MNNQDTTEKDHVNRSSTPLINARYETRLGGRIVATFNANCALLFSLSRHINWAALAVFLKVFPSSESLSLSNCSVADINL